MVDTLCKEFENYAQAKDKKTGEPTIIRLDSMEYNIKRNLCAIWKIDKFLKVQLLEYWIKSFNNGTNPEKRFTLYPQCWCLDCYALRLQNPSNLNTVEWVVEYLLLWECQLGELTSWFKKTFHSWPSKRIKLAQIFFLLQNILLEKKMFWKRECSRMINLRYFIRKCNVDEYNRWAKTRVLISCMMQTCEWKYLPLAKIIYYDCLIAIPFNLTILKKRPLHVNQFI